MFHDRSWGNGWNYQQKENDLPKELVGMGQQALTLILKLIWIKWNNLEKSKSAVQMNETKVLFYLMFVLSIIDFAASVTTCYTFIIDFSITNVSYILWHLSYHVIASWSCGDNRWRVKRRDSMWHYITILRRVMLYIISLSSFYPLKIDMALKITIEFMIYYY